LQKNLQASLNKINGIIITTDFKFRYFEYPTLERLASEDPLIRSKATSAAVYHLEEASDHYKNYKQLKLDLESFKEDAKKVKKATIILQNSLFEIMEKTGNGLTEFSSLFGFAALDIINHISPLLAEIQTALDGKIKDIDNLLVMKSSSYKNIHYNTRYFLTTEKEILEKQIRSHDSLNAEMQKEGEKMVENYNEMAVKNRENINIILHDEYIRLLVEDKEAENGRENLGLMIDVAERKESNYKNMNFTACPVGKPYNECTHIDLKNNFDINKKNLKENISILRREIKIKLPIVNAKTVQNNKNRELYTTLDDRLLKELESKEVIEKQKISDYIVSHDKIKAKGEWLKQYLFSNSLNISQYERMSFE
jgi:hypothetical protein